MKQSLKQTAKRIAGALGVQRPLTAQEREQWDDARAFAERVAPVLGAKPQAAKDKGVAIIVALHTHLPTAKTEGLLCKALQAQGLRIKLLLPPGDCPARTAYTALGLSAPTDSLA